MALALNGSTHCRTSGQTFMCGEKFAPESTRLPGFFCLGLAGLGGQLVVPEMVAEDRRLVENLGLSLVSAACRPVDRLPLGVLIRAQAHGPGSNAPRPAWPWPSRLWSLGNEVQRVELAGLHRLAEDVCPAPRLGMTVQADLVAQVRFERVGGIAVVAQALLDLWLAAGDEDELLGQPADVGQVADQFELPAQGLFERVNPAGKVRPGGDHQAQRRQQRPAVPHAAADPPGVLALALGLDLGLVDLQSPKHAGAGAGGDLGQDVDAIGPGLGHDPAEHGWRGRYPGCGSPRRFMYWPISTQGELSPGAIHNSGLTFASGFSPLLPT